MSEKRPSRRARFNTAVMRDATAKATCCAWATEATSCGLSSLARGPRPPSPRRPDVTATGKMAVHRVSSNSPSRSDPNCSTAPRIRFRVSLTIPPHSLRPSQNRSYEAFVRNTSSNPSAVPTSVCSSDGIATGNQWKWTATTAMVQTAHNDTRPLISRRSEPRISKKWSNQRWGSY